MQTTTRTQQKNIAITKNVVAKKAETYRLYGYTNQTNIKWIEKNAKNFGSKAKFLDALITAARKQKIVIAAPKTVIKKKVQAKKRLTKTSKKLQ